MAEKPATQATVIILVINLWLAMSIYFVASVLINNKAMQRIESRCTQGK
jgi:type IV secretory pathway TrbD component